MSWLPPRRAGDPARDQRFRVVDRWAEMTNLPDGHASKIAEFLHRQMSEELDSLEVSARNLTDFPDADWELRLEIARQCWDEARHAAAFREAFERRGGRVGEYPVMVFQYRIITRIPSLIGRLAVQNRSFEGAGLDAIKVETETERTEADADLAHLFDAQLADEIQHVRFANQWIERLRERDGPRALLDVARAVNAAGESLRDVAGPGMIFFPVADQLRREAGFDEAAIEAAKSNASGG